MEFNKEKITKPIGWIFRRNLDYVSLDFINGDFLWKIPHLKLETRLKNKLNKLIKPSKKKDNKSITG